MLTDEQGKTQYKTLKEAIADRKGKPSRCVICKRELLDSEAALYLQCGKHGAREVTRRLV